MSVDDENDNCQLSLPSVNRNTNKKYNRKKLTNSLTNAKKYRNMADDEKGEVISDDENDDNVYNGQIKQSSRKDMTNITSNNEKMKINECVTTQKQKKVEEDSEIDDLEDGELKSDSDDDEEIAIKLKDVNSVQTSSTSLTTTTQTNNQAGTSKERSNIYMIRASERSPDDGVCRFFLRGMCTWGEGCKYFHPPESEFAYHSQIFRQQRQQQIINKDSNPTQKTPTKMQNSLSSSIPISSFHQLSSINSRTNFYNSNAVGSNATKQVENAWERGLRQARELVKKKRSGSNDVGNVEFTTRNNNNCDSDNSLK